jgi:hypothetical protein
MHISFALLGFIKKQKQNKKRLTRTHIETLRISFERLKSSQHDTERSSCDTVDLVWLRESNERLRKDVLKVMRYHKKRKRK